MKLYLTNSAASFTPTTIRGGWADETLTGVSALSTTKSGANTSAARAETSAVQHRTLLRRFVSEPFNNAFTLDTTYDIGVVFGAKESSTSADMIPKVYAFVTVGSTDTMRAQLANVIASASELSTATNGAGVEVVTAIGTTVTCQPGDRLVIELGYRADNLVTTSFTGTMWYGGTGGTDLTQGSTNTTTEPGWMDIPDATDALFGPPHRTGAVTDTIGLTNTGAGSKRATGAVSDSIALSQPLTGLHTRHVIDTAALADAVAGQHLGGPAAVVDTIGLTHTIVGKHIGGLVAVVDTIGLVETASAHIQGSLLPAPPDVEALTQVYQPPSRRSLRFIAQEAISGKFLDWDLPLLDPEITWTLSGPTMIRATIDPELRDVAELKLDAWSTMIHVEEDGEIRASGIMQPIAIEGESFVVEAVGVSAYPHDLPFWGEINEVQIDPLEVVRRIWAHVQGYPDSQLGVSVDATVSPIRLGEPAFQARDENGDLEWEDEEHTVPRMVSERPYSIAWYTDTDCGAEIDALIRATPADYVERATWNEARTDVVYRIELGYPRVGRKRTDLRCALDENMLAAFPLREEPGQYGSQIMVRGAGEGRGSVRGYAGVRSPKRLRRVKTVTDRTIRSNTVATRFARAELARAQAVLTIGEVVVDATHPNAPLGSYTVGDDVVVQGWIPYIGEVALWHRIIAYTWRPDTDTVTWTTRRSDQFSYGSPLVG